VKTITKLVNIETKLLLLSFCSLDHKCLPFVQKFLYQGHITSLHASLKIWFLFLFFLGCQRHKYVFFITIETSASDVASISVCRNKQSKMKSHYKVLVTEETGCAQFDVSWRGLCIDILAKVHGRMARGGHGLPKVSLGRAMPYPSMPYEQATP
jgi:hypothetical protein